MSKIKDIKAREVLDSRFKPTKAFTKSLEVKEIKDYFFLKIEKGHL